MVKKYLHSPKPGFLYVRVGGQYLGRVIAPPDTAEFDRQYWEILNGRKLKCRTSWTALITSYHNSDRWARLKPRTRADYEKVMLYVEEKNGTKDMTRLTRRDVIAAMDKNRHRVRFSNYIPQVMSVLCEHAIDIGWITANPAKGVRKTRTPDEKKRNHIPWTDAAVAKWRSEATVLPRLIFEIGVGIVQRTSDWTRFRWSDYDGDTLKLRQGKTDKALTLPCTRELRDALNGVKEKRGLTVLAGSNGQPMSYRYMAKIMLDERRRLGLEDHHLHAIRYRGVMELAWAGCSDDEIAGYSGHASKDMIRKYAGEARQIMRARQAWEKRQ